MSLIDREMLRQLLNEPLKPQLLTSGGEKSGSTRTDDATVGDNLGTKSSCSTFCAEYGCMCKPPVESGTTILGKLDGGIKDTGLRVDLIPVLPLALLADCYTRGLVKYPARNWEAGLKFSQSYQAAMRHMMLYWSGEDYDPETGAHHLSAAIFHLMAMQQFELTHKHLDDRVKPSEDVLEKLHDLIEQHRKRGVKASEA